MNHVADRGGHCRGGMGLNKKDKPAGKCPTGNRRVPGFAGSVPLMLSIPVIGTHGTPAGKFDFANNLLFIRASFSRGVNDR